VLKNYINDEEEHPDLTAFGAEIFCGLNCTVTDVTR
jgi:hypothetical protein